MEKQSKSKLLIWLSLILVCLFFNIFSKPLFFFLTNNPVFVLLALTLISMTTLFLAVTWFTEDKLNPPGRGPYIAAILPPLLWLLTPFMFSETKVPGYGYLAILCNVLIHGIGDWFILPFFLLFLVFTVYVFVGVKDGQAYKDLIKPRRPVWFVFGLGILFVIWFVPSTLRNVQEKFSGLYVDMMADVAEAVKDVNIAAGHLRDKGKGEEFKDALIEEANALKKSLGKLQVSMWKDSATLAPTFQSADKMASIVAEATALNLSADSAAEIDGALDNASVATKKMQKEIRSIAYSTAAAGLEVLAKNAKELGRQLENDILPEIDTARQKIKAVAVADKEEKAAVLKAVRDAKKALKALQKGVGTADDPLEGSVIHSVNIMAKMAAMKGMKTGFDEQTQRTILGATAQMLVLIDDIIAQASELNFSAQISKQSWRINEIQDKAHALELAGKALRIDLTTPMLMVSLLFIVFLLMPWLLYISFIVRKREQIVNDRLDLLSDLNLLERFQSTSKLSRDLTIEGANIARELAESQEVAYIQNSFGDRIKHLKEASLAFNKISDVIENKKSYMQEKEVGKTNKRLTKDEKKEIIRLADIETLNRQTFSSREYLIPLIILSVLSLVGWYYTILATGTNSLVRFIEQGGGSVQLTELLAKFTPFTMVFAGAWLFMVVMLTYRWVNNDLHPGSYFYASMRLVYGLLVGMVFFALFGKNANWFWLALAFFVGIAPLEFVYGLWGYLKDFAGNKEHANQILKYFNQPKWASHQPLTVLEDLTVWDDTRLWQEGIQNVHALATADLVRLAVRTPYDAQTLVDWTDQALLRIHTKVLWHAGMAAIGIRGASDLFDSTLDEKEELNHEKLTCVVNAFNAAHMLSIDTGDPRLIAYNQTMTLETAGNAMAVATEAAKDAVQNLDPAKPETLDKIIALRSQVRGLKTLAEAAVQSRRQAIDVLVIHAVDKEIVKTWADGGEVDRQLKALEEGADSLIIKAENAVKEDQLTSKMLEDDLAKAAEKDKPGQAALQAAQEAVMALVDPAEKAKKASGIALSELAEMKTAVQPLKEKVGNLKGRIETLVNQTAAAATKSDAVTPNAQELDKTLNELLTAASEAETAAGELEKAVKAEGVRFSVLQDRAAALKESLGTGENQLQAKIKTAKDQMLKVPNDANAVTAAKEAVKEVAAATGTAEAEDEKTIAGRMKAIAEPFEDAGVKVKKAGVSVTDLAKAIDGANKLAQSIKIGDDTTWDYVKALAGALPKFKTAVKHTEQACNQIIKKLEGLKEQQTIALLQARKSLKELPIENAKNDLEAAEKAFKDDAGKVVLFAGSSKGELEEAKKKTETAAATAMALASSVVEVAQEAKRTVLPFRLTKEILNVILGAMESDPNISYIRHFWKEQAKKAKRAGKA